MRAGSYLTISATLVVALATAAPAESPPSGASTPAPDQRQQLFEGLGSLHHPVTTSSPVAQRYFDQGLRLIYAFNHDEAAASFREATRLDPKMAMAYWGIALALGPNINLPEDPERGKAAYEAISKAKSLEDGASLEKRSLID